MKIYENYPEILNIKAKVLDKRFKNNISQIIVDKNIFMADDNELINDYKSLDDKEVIEVKENRGKLLISVDGKISKEEVILEVDKKLRYRNLSYNTAYILFQIFLEGFYGKIKTNLFLNEDEAYISLINYRDDIDPELFDEMINYAIDSSLPITSNAGITEVAGLGTVINSNICFNNTYKIIKFKVLDVHKDGKNTIISFSAGR
ncbi:hypothetical protein [uncultured Anaerococcus sp.]|uniref:hypothetical protein n=1 Tax=uncultured Anaerococcus sp. TaxID=293428 RepID=UPI0025CF74D0|nr:hypothetical protein [uncultured Anaerococcus sp.]